MCVCVCVSLSPSLCVCLCVRVSVSVTTAWEVPTASYTRHHSRAWREVGMLDFRDLYHGGYLLSLSLSILAIHLYDNLPGDSSSLQLSPANYIVQTHLSNLAALRSATVDLTRFGPGSWPLKYFLLSISTWCIWIRLISSIVFTPLGVPFATNLPLPLRFASVYRSSAQGCVHALVAMLKVAFQSTRPPRCPSCLSFPSFRCQKVPLQHSSSGVR